MTSQALTDGTNVAWITVAGTLGGVAVTAVFGVVTAVITQRWQYRRGEQEHRFGTERELRNARRDCYVRYIVSAQKVFDQSYDLYLRNRKTPVPVDEFSSKPPQPLQDALTR